MPGRARMRRCTRCVTPPPAGWPRIRRCRLRTDVQFVLGHAQLTTTQIYLTPRKEDVIRRVLAHHAGQVRQAGRRARPVPAPGYRPAVTASVMARTLSQTGLIVAAKGGLVRDITAGDVLELLDTEAGTHASSTGDTAVFYRLLRLAGSFGPAAPETLRALRTIGQRTPQEMIDRYHLACRPVRDLLVDYLRERQPAVDYITLESFARSLGRDFWQDLERHHPGICTLQLPPETASSWKQRRRTKPKTVTDTGTGEKTAVAVPRLNHRECLTRVRAFYLDIAQWAAEDPARWGPWVARCPVSAAEINQRKAARHRKSRMDARTRERLPVLPALVQAVSRRRETADALLRAARATAPGQAFSAAGQTLTRSVTLHATSTKVWADDPAAGRRRDLTLEEDHAFWSWAIVEVLRATGKGSASRNCWRSLTTAWSSTGCPPRARSSRYCRSLRPRPTLSGCWWSARTWPTCCRRSSAGCAATGTAAQSRWCRPMTRWNARGCRHHQCCSSAASAPRTAGSAAAPPATCSTPRWPAPAWPPLTAALCAAPRMTSAGSSSPTRS
jgi:hypothetical protein